LFNIVLSHTYKYVCKLAWPRVSFICRWGIVGGAKIGGEKELRGGWFTWPYFRLVVVHSGFYGFPFPAILAIVCRQPLAKWAKAVQG